METKTLKVALTGGIGSGKTYALNVLKDAGYHTISCDAVYADIFKKQSFLRQLKKLFPDAVTGIFRLKADRKKISKAVFGNKEKLSALNALTHPLIFKECFFRAEKGGNKVAVIEVPLLFESGLEGAFEKVIVIVRDKAERIKSVTTRSMLTEEQVLSRMRSQVDYDTVDLSPYIVIKNEGDFKSKVLQAVSNIVNDN